MSRRQEMIGKKFGKLTVKRISDNRSGKRKRLMYYCDCDCGNKDVEVVGEKLRSGQTKSCGCLRKEMLITRKKFNKYDLTGKYGIGWTTNTDEEFYFDLEDFDKIKNFSWYKMNNGYIATHSDDKTIIYLHRFVMNAMDVEIVDHKKHNLNDVRKEFLRIGNQCKNMMNTSPRKDNKSGVPGVWYNKERNTWVAEIWVNKTKIVVGSYKNKEDAINARKDAENKFFNEWSYENSMMDYIET